MINLMKSNTNLYLPGLLPDGTPKTLVSIPGFWANQNCDQFNGAKGDLYMPEVGKYLHQAANKACSALVLLERIDNATGKVLSRFVSHNIETDNFFNNQVLKIIGSSAYTPALGQYLAIDTHTAVAQLSGTTTVSTSVASFAVLSGGNPTFAAGNASTTFQRAATTDGTKQNTTGAGSSATQILGDPRYGTGNHFSIGTAREESINGSTTTNNATTINVSNSPTSEANYTTTVAHNTNDWVVAGSSTSDGPTSAPTGAVISPAQAASATAGNGIGQRLTQLQYTFPGASVAAGSYTALWTITVSTTGAWTASTVAYGHLVSAPQTINSSTSLQATYIYQF